jgi:hypothetical protein
MAQDNQRLQATVEFTERRFRKLQEQLTQLRTVNDNNISTKGYNNNNTNINTVIHRNSIDLSQDGVLTDGVLTPLAKINPVLSGLMTSFSSNSSIKGVEASPSLERLSRGNSTYFSDKSSVKQLVSSGVNKNRLVKSKNQKANDITNNLRNGYRKIDKALALSFAGESSINNKAM